MSRPQTRPQALTPALLPACAERLAAILEQENVALAAHDEAAIRALLPQKRAACAAFEASLHTAATGDAPGASPDPLPRAAADRLRRAAGENSRRLAAAIAARKQVLELVASAARAHDQGAGVYARSGASARSRSVSIAPTALSFDRAL